MARVIGQGDLRPMSGNAEAMDDLKRILIAREPLYRKADAVVDTSGQDVEASLARLRAALKL
jgi:XRE family aerobic/anaerobic benzoate catabolism transcriptional regulator